MLISVWIPLENSRYPTLAIFGSVAGEMACHAKLLFATNNYFAAMGAVITAKHAAAAVATFKDGTGPSGGIEIS